MKLEGGKSIGIEEVVDHLHLQLSVLDGTLL
jgi:hypothetical protein